MQIYVLAIILALLVSQTPGLGVRPALGGWTMLAASVGPYVLIAAMAWLACRITRAGMRARPALAIAFVNRLHMALTALRWMALGVFFASVFALGYLDWLRDALGRWMLVNELIALAGPMGVVGFMWWAYYPIDRRLRESMLIRNLDEGQPLFAMYGRGAYVFDQFRHQVLVVLAPMLLILLWVQFVHRAADRWSALGTYEPLLMAGGGLAVFALAPLIIRFVWNTRRMPDGPLRRRLVELCKRHGVKVRELLLWHTHGGQINGAVMGLVGPLRYIMLTDGLVERMDDRQVEAVMAHELGHVRRRHMPWMAICALGTLAAVMVAIEQGAAIIDSQFGWDGLHRAVATVGMQAPDTLSGAVGGAALLGALVAWAAAFGYISRRFERQADTFAVQHLAEAYREDEGRTDGPPTIGPRAVADMAGALEEVCRLNHSPTSRPSWRHGSVDWRIEYLRSLVGRRIDDCPIDRRVRRLCLIGAVLLAASIVVEFVAL